MPIRGVKHPSPLTPDEMRRARVSGPFAFLLPILGDEGRSSYIIPDMSGMPPPPPPEFFSGASATIASVVRMFFAIDAAF